METIEKNNLQTDQEMNEKHFSQGSIADFPMHPPSIISTQNESSNNAEKSQIANELGDGFKPEVPSVCLYQLTNHIERPPTSIQLKKFKPTPCQCYMNHSVAQKVQSSRCIFRNNNFSGNFERNLSFHNGILQNNRLDADRENFQGYFSRNSSNHHVYKPTLWSRMRKFLKFPKTDHSQDHLFVQPSTGAFELKDLLVYGMKKYSKFTSTIKKSNTHKIEVTFPSIHVAANYEMNNFQFLSGKLNGNGEMDLILNNVKAKVLVSTVKDYRQNTLKNIIPNVELKFKSARIHLSSSSDVENARLNKNFKLVMKKIEPSISGIVSRKIADKLYPFFHNFNEAF